MNMNEKKNKILIRRVKVDEKSLINDLVTIHLETFTGFFLTFMGRGFLNQMYCSYCEHGESGLYVAEYSGRPVGFLAFSSDYSDLYKYMLKKKWYIFGLYSIKAFFRRPSIFFHIISAFFKPKEVIRNEKYVELSSIGIDPNLKSKGIGSLLIEKLKEDVDFNIYDYITLETDAINNENAIHFYEKNGFVKQRIYRTREMRVMVEYRYYKTSGEYV